MPDTGAPWNIPYVAGTDLVSDWPTDSLALANAIASGLDAAGNAGIGSNVVQTVKTDTFSTTSTGWTAVTGLSASITPTSTSSKVLIIVDAKLNYPVGADALVGVRVTGGNSATYVGDAAGSRQQFASASMTTRGGALDAAFTRSMLDAGFVYLDSPNTVSSTTYQVEIFRTAGTSYLNRSDLDEDILSVARTASSITIIEVAA